MTRRIYLASSWKNEEQPNLINQLLSEGHHVYDFRHPTPHIGGFAWSEIDPDWKLWHTDQFAGIVQTDLRCAQGFTLDMHALRWCDTCILLQPCGRSAHLEFGWACGAGKFTLAYIDGEPDLMLLMADVIVTNESNLLDALR